MTRFPPTIPRRSRLLFGTCGVLGFLLIWWLVTLPVFSETEIDRQAILGPNGEITGYDEVRTEVTRALVNPPGLDTPGRTFRRAWEIDLPQHVLRSALRILLGFLISSAIAVPLGIAMGLYPKLRATINPIISFLRPLPSIAWVPLALIWLGVGEGQKLAIIFMGSFSAALIYTVEATMRVDPDLIRAAQNLGTSNRQLLTRVLLPAALPNILSGLKVVLAICWTCVISAEIVGTKFGLGSLIWQRKEISDTAAVVVGMACISTVVLILDALFGVIERKLLPWMQVGEDRS